MVCVEVCIWSVIFRFVCLLCILRCVNGMSYDWLLLSSVQHIHVANFILQILVNRFLNLIHFSTSFVNAKYGLFSLECFHFGPWA